MFLTNCPECGVPIEIPADAVGPDRTDPWNVIECELCEIIFDYDDADVREVAEFDATPEQLERLRRFNETGFEPDEESPAA